MALNWQHIKGVYGDKIKDKDYYTYVEWSTTADVAPVLYFSEINYNTRAEIVNSAVLMGSIILSNIDNDYYGNNNYYGNINIWHHEEDQTGGPGHKIGLFTISTEQNQLLINKYSSNSDEPTIIVNTNSKFVGNLNASNSIFGNIANNYLHIDPYQAKKITSSMPIEVKGSIITVGGSKITSEYVEAPYFNATSDIRAKTNINPFNTSAIDIVKSLNTYTYTYKDSGLISYGIMAQDVQTLKINDFAFVNNPDASGENGDYMSIKEDKLVYLLLEAVKEQQKQIDKLEKEIEVLQHE